MRDEQISAERWAADVIRTLQWTCARQQATMTRSCLLEDRVISRDKQRSRIKTHDAGAEQCNSAGGRNERGARSLETPPPDGPLETIEGKTDTQRQNVVWLSLAIAGPVRGTLALVVDEQSMKLQATRYEYLYKLRRGEHRDATLDVRFDTQTESLRMSQFEASPKYAGHHSEERSTA